MSAFRPQDIVSTIASPELDGFTVVRRLRHVAPEIAAIALGVVSRAEELRGAGYAFDVQLPRSVDPALLVDTVREVLARDAPMSAAEGALESACPLNRSIPRRDG